MLMNVIFTLKEKIDGSEEHRKFQVSCSWGQFIEFLSHYRDDILMFTVHDFIKEFTPLICNCLCHKRDAQLLDQVGLPDSGPPLSEP